MKPIEIRGRGVIVSTNQHGVISFESLLCGKQLVDSRYKHYIQIQDNIAEHDNILVITNIISHCHMAEGSLLSGWGGCVR